MRLDSWPVTKDHGPRPAGPPDRCFYCNQGLGDEHEADCVMRTRTVVIQMTLRYPIEVPEAWTAEQIEFHRNLGTWCASNAVREIDRLYGDDGQCMCGVSRFDVLREATEQETLEAGLLKQEGRPQGKETP